MATSYAAAGSPVDAALRSRAVPMEGGRPSLDGGCGGGVDWRMGRFSGGLRASDPVKSFFGADGPEEGGVRSDGFSASDGVSPVSKKFNGSGSAGPLAFGVGRAGVKLGRVDGASKAAAESTSVDLDASGWLATMLAVVSFSKFETALSLFVSS
jgi:hypothetical protein